MELTEEEINSRAAAPPHHASSIEELIEERELEAMIMDAVNTLPEPQRRRFILHYKYELSYAQIAEVENCTFQAVAKSIVIAKQKIKRIFN